MGVAAADFDNDGWQDILITAVGQNRLFRNTGKGTFADVTDAAGLGKRAGLQHVGALVRLRPRRLARPARLQLRASGRPTPTCSAAWTASRSRTARRRRIAARRSWLFRNRRNGTFEDVTAKAGLFDATSKSLGVTLLDYDLDVWPDLFIANDTQPNKLYRNNGNGTFTELGLAGGPGVQRGGPRAGRHGRGCGRCRQHRHAPSVVVTNFSGEMLGLYRPVGGGQYPDVSPRIGHRPRDAPHARVRLLLLRRRSRRPAGSARRQRPHRRHDQQVAGARHLRRSAAPVPQRRRRARSTTSPRRWAARSRSRRSAAAPPSATSTATATPTSSSRATAGPAFLYRNDVLNGNRVIRLTLRGTKSNRDAIGAKVRVTAGGQRYSKMVKTGSSYLSQSELPLSFGLGAAHGGRPGGDRVAERRTRRAQGARGRGEL